MFAVTGKNTTIVKAVEYITGEEACRVDADLSNFKCEFKIPEGTSRFVLAAGVLVGKPSGEQSADEFLETVAVNLINVRRLCDYLLDTDPTARICVIGSESGYRGSFDTTYAMSKAAVHHYVVNKKLIAGQQLVSVAPHIILDSGMTRRRHDYEELESSGRKFITPKEIAEMIKTLLWSDWPWVNNTVIRMAG